MPKWYDTKVGTGANCGWPGGGGGGGALDPAPSTPSGHGSRYTCGAAAPPICTVKVRGPLVLTGGLGTGVPGGGFRWSMTNGNPPAAAGTIRCHVPIVGSAMTLLGMTWIASS